MTRIERELLKECRTIAAAQSMPLVDVIRDAHRFWCGPGRCIHTRGWAARAAAAARLLAQHSAAHEPRLV